MSISGNPLRDFDISGDVISDEIISVPATSPYQVYPEFTPQKNSPTSTQIWTSPVLVGTQYTEKTDPNLVLASGDFYTNYNRGGFLTFHSSAAGLSLYMTYNEVGTFMRVTHINDIRNSVGSGDIADADGNVNLVSHANDDNIHGTGSLSAHSGDPGAHSQLTILTRHSGDPGAHSIAAGWTDDGTVVRTTTAGNRVGIGTSNPGSAIDISGDVHLTNINLAGLPSVIRASGDIEIYPNSKIGICKSPSYKLDVNGAINMNGFYMSSGASGGLVLMSDSSGGGTWQSTTNDGGGGIVTPPGGGEIDDYVVLLLHSNGADG